MTFIPDAVKRLAEEERVAIMERTRTAESLERGRAVAAGATFPAARLLSTDPIPPVVFFGQREGQMDAAQLDEIGALCERIQRCSAIRLPELLRAAAALVDLYDEVRLYRPARPA